MGAIIPAIRRVFGLNRKGLVPAPTSLLNYVLRDDGTWVAGLANYKGDVAGGSVASTSTAAGDWYMITSAGTSQTITWAVGDIAVYKGTSGQWSKISGAEFLAFQSIATQARYSGTDDFLAISGATSGRRKISPMDQAGQWRNALAPRGGVAFDGTTSGRVYATLTGQVIGTDPFSLCVAFKVPTTAPAANAGIIYVGEQATSVGSNNFAAWLDATGNIRIYFRDTTGNNAVGYYINSVIANFGGKAIHLAIVRNSSGDPTAYINGVPVTLSTAHSSGSGQTWQSTLNSTYLGIGYATSTEIAITAFYSASLYNLALSAADVLEIYELGGAVPFRYQFGSQSELATNGDFASSTGWTAQAGWAIAAGTATATAAATDKYLFRAPASSLALRKKYRVAFTVSGFTAGAVRAYVSTSAAGSTSLGTSRSANGTYSEDLECTLANNEIGLVTVGTTTLSVDNFSVKQIGAVCHLPLNDGIGYQLHDESTNKLDAVMTTTGVAHLIPQRRGYVRGTLTWAGTHEGKSLLGQRALPDGAMVTQLVRKPTASSSGSGCTIGTTNSATRWQALAALTANTKAVATLANQLPAGTADADTDILVDPDTANYTGSITLEAHYALTEGT
jgi:hypothetical protein